MTAKQYRALLAKLGITQERMAEALGIGKRTSQGYAIGDPIPMPTGILLSLLSSGEIAFEDIERAGKRLQK